MNSASNGRPVILRVGAVAFALSMMGGFVWYSHVRAQPHAGVAAAGEPTPATILPGSKRANVAVTPGDLQPREDGTIDLNLETAQGDLKVGERTILPSSKLGVFRDVASSPGPMPTSVTGDQPVAPSLPPQPAAPPQAPSESPRVILFSGSKTFAGPVISAPSGVLTIGSGAKEGASVSPPVEISSKQASPDTPPPSRIMMLGSKSMPSPPVNPEVLRKLVEKSDLPPVQQPDASSPDPAWNQGAPIFTSSKSGPIFRPGPPSPPPAAQTQLPVPNTSPEAAKTEKPVVQPQAETPSPASP